MFGQPSPGIEKGGHEGEVATGGIAGIAVARRRSESKVTMRRGTAGKPGGP